MCLMSFNEDEEGTEIVFEMNLVNIHMQLLMVVDCIANTLHRTISKQCCVITSFAVCVMIVCVWVCAVIFDVTEQRRGILIS